MLPSKAVLRGKFLADDRLVGIRLNGRRLPVPLHRDGLPFLDWTGFQISSGFVRGENVLEFDVLNANPYLSPNQRRTAKSRMSFRASCRGRPRAIRSIRRTGRGRRGLTAKGKTAATKPKKIGAGGT